MISVDLINNVRARTVPLFVFCSGSDCVSAGFASPVAVEVNCADSIAGTIELGASIDEVVALAAAVVPVPRADDEAEVGVAASAAGVASKNIGTCEVACPETL